MTTVIASDGFQYDYEDGQLTITELPTSDTYHGVRRGAIDTYNFTGATKVIYNGVKRIPGTDFKDCTALKEVVMSNLPGRISTYAFQGCVSLQYIDMPANIVSLGTSCFQGDYSVKAVVLRYTGQVTLEENCLALGTAEHPVHALLFTPTGWANDTVLASAKNEYTTFEYVTGLPLDCQYMSFDGSAIQVESAIRDGEGNVITDHYMTTGEMLAKLEYVSSNSISITVNQYSLSTKNLTITGVDSDYSYIVVIGTSTNNIQIGSLYGANEISSGSTSATVAIAVYNGRSDGAWSGTLRYEVYRAKTSVPRIFLLSSNTYPWLANRLQSTKQDVLTFDTAPVSGSTNPVTSDGIYTALQGAGGATIFTNQSASSWVADSTYADFPYRCAIALTGVTASDVAEVIYGLDQATSGDYAPICETYAGGVYIYSTVNTSITIPTIMIHKG